MILLTRRSMFLIFLPRIPMIPVMRRRVMKRYGEREQYIKRYYLHSSNFRVLNVQLWIRNFPEMILWGFYLCSKRLTHLSFWNYGCRLGRSEGVNALTSDRGDVRRIGLGSLHNARLPREEVYLGCGINKGLPFLKTTFGVFMGIDHKDIDTASPGPGSHRRNFIHFRTNQRAPSAKVSD